MKNVAATSGHNVSFATFFLAVVSTWEGSWEGKDNVLNFYFRPPQATLALVRARPGASSRSKNTMSTTPCKKKMRRAQYFSSARQRTRPPVKRTL
jgi:hypothetical protein